MNSTELFALTLKTLQALSDARTAYINANTPEELRYLHRCCYAATLGPRYVKLFRDEPGQGRSCIGMIDTTNGDLLKVGGKGARGNAARGDFACCNPHRIR